MMSTTGANAEEALDTLSAEELAQEISQIRTEQGCKTKIKSTSQHVFVIALRQQQQELLWAHTGETLTTEMAEKFQRFSEDQGADRATIASISTKTEENQSVVNNLSVNYLSREELLSEIDTQSTTHHSESPPQQSQSDQPEDPENSEQNGGKRIPLPLRTRFLFFVFGSSFLLAPTYLDPIIGWIGVALGLGALYSALRGSWSQDAAERVRNAAEDNPYLGDTYTVYVWLQKLMGIYHIVVPEEPNEDSND